MRRAQPLQLSRVTIQNVRCFEDLTIDLSVGKRARKWAVIFGDNGVGKSTLLKCIALGMCDEASAAGLLADIYGDFNRDIGEGALDAKIELELVGHGAKAVITTEIKSSGRRLVDKVTQTAIFNGSEQDFPWDRIFACGYGAARRSFGTKDYNEYATVDAVYTIFNYDWQLQSPELVIRRIDKALSDKPARRKSKGHTNGNGSKKSELDGLLNSLARVLLLEPGSVKLESSGLMISGPWGNFQPIGALGDGYQATLAWISDFLGWVMLDNPKQPLSEVRGIVLVDEIEQHLHPRWQRKIIGLLDRQFPNVQFVVTTHTPMCAIGTTELSDDDCQLVKLDRLEKSVRAHPHFSIPRGKRADQILTSYLFGLPTSGDNETMEEIARFNELAMKPPNDRLANEQREFETLRAKLSSQFTDGESDLESFVRDEVRKALQARAEQTFSSLALDMEVARQMRELSE